MEDKINNLIERVKSIREDLSDDELVGVCNNTIDALNGIDEERPNHEIEMLVNEYELVIDSIEDVIYD